MAGAWAAILLIFVSVYLGSAFSPALQDDADSSHAEAAREMVVKGDYVTLHMNGVRYLEKAPMIYWLVAFSYRVFGVNEFAARLPTLLSMFLMVLLGFRWGRQAFGLRAGAYAALFVTTAAGFYLFTRILIPEALLSLLIAASFYCFVTALDDPAQGWRWYAGYACLALAVLTKGLIPLVFVGITAVAYVAISGDWRRWREFRIPSGLLLFFLIAAPWHILAGVRNPHFFWFYFVNEHFLRFLGKRYPVDYNKVPAALYWSLHLVWLFPWSLYLPLAIRDLRRDFRALRQSGEVSFGLRTRMICWIWAGVVLTFFAFSTSQEYYTFPAYFPLILLLASSTAEYEEEAGRRRWLTAIAAITAAITLAAAIALSAGLWTSRNLPFVSDIGSVLAKHDMSEDTLSMSHMLDLTGESFAALRLPALLAVVALVLGPLSSLYLRMRRKHYAATLAMALTMGLFLVARQRPAGPRRRGRPVAAHRRGDPFVRPIDRHRRPPRWRRVRRCDPHQRRDRHLQSRQPDARATQPGQPAARQGVHVTASVGLTRSTEQPHYRDSDQLIDEADQAMYRAKKASGNRLVTMTSPVEPAAGPASHDDAVSERRRRGHAPAGSRSGRAHDVLQRRGCDDCNDQLATMPIVPAGRTVDVATGVRLPSRPMRSPLITCRPSVRL